MGIRGVAENVPETVDELFCPRSTLVMVNNLVHGDSDLGDDDEDLPLVE